MKEEQCRVQCLKKDNQILLVKIVNAIFLFKNVFFSANVPRLNRTDFYKLILILNF